MKTTKITILALVAALALSVSAFAAQEGSAKKKKEGSATKKKGGGKGGQLFDGKTLEGWTQKNGTATYKVEDGTIVGRTAKGSPNSFLCSNQQYADFELEFDVKCDVGLNSGVQIRSRQKTAKDAPPAKDGKKPAKNNQKGRVFGPQVEIETSPGQAGYIYGEATEFKWLSEAPRSKDKAVNQHSHYKNDEWNHFRVVAKGANIQTFINGKKIADLTHEGIYKTHPRGFIGLQVHGVGDKGPFQVAWKNLKIKRIPKVKAK